jgi:hypothetical protein
MQGGSRPRPWKIIEGTAGVRCTDPHHARFELMQILVKHTRQGRKGLIEKSESEFCSRPLLTKKLKHSNSTLKHLIEFP